MLLPPDHLDSEALRAAVQAGYGRPVDALEFHPLGEDSWAFATEDLWISVRRDLRGHVPGAYQVASALRDAGHDRVLAPLADRDGAVVCTVAGSPVVVFPRVDAVQTDPDAVSDEEFATVVTLIRGVHGARPQAELPTEDFTLGFADDLDAALAFSEGPAPRREPAARLHGLLVRNRAHVDRLLAEHRERSARLRADQALIEGFGLTHGEPSAPNVLRARDGFLLADWGGAMWGPPERDWFHVQRTFGRAPVCRPEVLRFYEIRWELSEISEYVTILRDAHGEDRETVAMWRRLTRFLPDV